MRLDPAKISDALLNNAGGAADAAAGQRTARQAEQVAPEAEYESMDSLLLKRLRASAVSDAAASTISAADAHDLAARTRELMVDRPDTARATHADLARDRLRNLLGD